VIPPELDSVGECGDCLSFPCLNGAWVRGLRRTFYTLDFDRNFRMVSPLSVLLNTLNQIYKMGIRTEQSLQNCICMKAQYY